MRPGLSGGIAAVGAVLVAVLPATAATSRTAGHSNCPSPAPVVAHHSGGKVLHTQPRHRPHACGTNTGYPAAESHLVVRRNGGVVFTPAVLPSGLAGTGTAPIDENSNSQSNASPGAMAVTDDGGAHWRVGTPAGATWTPTVRGESVDPATGRLFSGNAAPIPLEASYGPDQEGPAQVSW